MQRRPALILSAALTLVVTGSAVALAAGTNPFRGPTPADAATAARGGTQYDDTYVVVRRTPPTTATKPAASAPTPAPPAPRTATADVRAFESHDETPVVTPPVTTVRHHEDDHGDD